MVYAVIFALLLGLDQVVKHVVKTSMELYESIPVIQNIFHITYVQNTGAAFSILQGKQLFLIGLSILVFIILLVVLIKNKKHSVILNLSLTMILAGGIGNLIDRLFYGYVIDLFDFRVFPVFNVADSAISVGVVLLAVYLIFLEGRKEADGSSKNYSA